VTVRPPSNLIGYRLSILLVPVLALAVLNGCASGAATAVGVVANIALQAAGLKKEDKGPPPPKLIELRIHTGNSLNADDSGHGLAVVARVYKLRDANAFVGAPYSAFGSADREKLALGDDLIEVREMVLMPGQKVQLRERMTSDMAYLGVVAQFRRPAPDRWHFAFAQADIEKTGVTIGVHDCALTVTEGKAFGVDSALAALLAPVECGAAPDIEQSGVRVSGT
jgi:type VI secretion system protein VasD